MVGPKWAILLPEHSRSSSIKTEDMHDELTATPKKRKALILPSASTSQRKRPKHPSPPLTQDRIKPRVSPAKAPTLPLFLPRDPSSHSESSASPSPTSIFADYDRRRSFKATTSLASTDKKRRRQDLGSPNLQRNIREAKSQLTSFQNDRAGPSKDLVSEVIEISDDDEEVAPPFAVEATSQARRSDAACKLHSHQVIVISDSEDELVPPLHLNASNTPIRTHATEKISPAIAHRPESGATCVPSPLGNQLSDIDLPASEAQHDQEIALTDDPAPNTLEARPVKLQPIHFISSPQTTEDPPSVRISEPDDIDSSDLPRLHVKSLLYGGDDGFFKEAFHAIRHVEAPRQPVTSQTFSQQANIDVVPQQLLVSTDPVVGTICSSHLATPNVDHEKDLSDLNDLHTPPLAAIGAKVSTSQIPTQPTSAIIPAQSRSPSADSLNIIERQAANQIILTYVIDEAWEASSSKNRPPVPPGPVEIIDLTIDTDGEDGREVDEYEPSTVATAIAFDTLLSSQAKWSEEPIDVPGVSRPSNSPLTTSILLQQNASGDALSPLEIIRNAMNQNKQAEEETLQNTVFEVKQSPLSEELRIPSSLNVGNVAVSHPGYTVLDEMQIEPDTLSINQVLTGSRDDEDERECLDMLEYPPSSDEENPELEYPDLDQAIQSSSSTMSSSNDATVESDTDDELLVRIYRNSSESLELTGAENLLLTTPQQIRWNGGCLADFPPVRFTKDIPHLIQDRLNQMDAFYRASDMARVVFEAAIVENTAEDEPMAPPIRVINDIDNEATPPWEFHYSNQMWLGEGVPTPDYENLEGCGCRGRCDPKSKTCFCVLRQQQYTEDKNGFIWDEKGRLREHGCPIFECNELCGCTEDCPNRIVQQGRRYPVNIVKTELKGWGVFAGERKIPTDTFLGIYAGEYLTNDAGEERGLKYNKFGRTYLFDIDFHYLNPIEDHEWEVRYVVDAYHVGNFTRFLNHSCNPNCTINPVIINEADTNKPLLAIFTQTDVEPYQELCFSYFGFQDENERKPDQQAANGNGNGDKIYVKCCCGASNCTGEMFKALPTC